MSVCRPRKCQDFLNRGKNRQVWTKRCKSMQNSIKNEWEKLKNGHWGGLVKFWEV